jgi:hypothetical protein
LDPYTMIEPLVSGKLSDSTVAVTWLTIQEPPLFTALKMSQEVELAPIRQ